MSVLHAQREWHVNMRQREWRIKGRIRDPGSVARGVRVLTQLTICFILRTSERRTGMRFYRLIICIARVRVGDMYGLKCIQ
jgi:hypothetical protein